MTRLAPIRSAVLAAMLAALAVGMVGCTRNYDSGPSGDQAGTNNGENNGVEIGSQSVPYLDSIGEADALHLGFSPDTTVIDLGQNRHVVYAGSYSIVWDSALNKVVGRVSGTSLTSSTKVIWSPGDGTVALVQNGGAFYWVSAANNSSTMFDVGSLNPTLHVFDDVVLAVSFANQRLKLVEISSDQGSLDLNVVADLPGSRAESVKRVGNLYHYRDEAWNLQVRLAGADEVTQVGQAFREMTFDGDRYLYFEAEEPWLFDTFDGARVAFPEQWRLYNVDDPENEWVYLQAGRRIAFWQPGKTPVEPDEPPSDVFLGFIQARAEPEFGSVEVATSRGNFLRLYDYENEVWWEIEGVEDAPRRSPPTTARLANGDPVVIWAGQFGDSLEGAHFWTPDTGVTPLSGYRDTLSFWTRTTDPTRFVARTMSNRTVLADIERRNMMELGLPVNCQNMGMSVDGRRALTYVNETISLFDADTLSSQVIARSPVFFGSNCEHSFNSSLSRGLFVDAFDGEIGDLSYWNGERVTTVIEGIPPTGAVLDPVRGLWTIAAQTGRTIFIAVFESEGEALTRIGRASAQNLDYAYDYADLEFVYLDTKETSPARATIYRQALEVDPEPYAVASGAFTRVLLVGDDILAINQAEDLPTNVILTTDGPIDPGVLADFVSADTTDEQDPPGRPPGRF